uniref:Uncharacterized protein n=1 Tax=Alexandrium monilatum TaxID=311494 RepID=A0A7S4T353_9DINO
MAEVGTAEVAGGRMPSTFESNPSKSVADFPSMEFEQEGRNPMSAATSELEAKLRLRMLKCEGSDFLYKTQVPKSCERNPSRPPARLKQNILKTEVLKLSRAESFSEIKLVNELEMTASYKRCTQARTPSAHTRSRPKASGSDTSSPKGRVVKQTRPHSVNEAREACVAGRSATALRSKKTWPDEEDLPQAAAQTTTAQPILVAAAVPAPTLPLACSARRSATPRSRKTPPDKADLLHAAAQATPAAVSAEGPARTPAARPAPHKLTPSTSPSLPCSSDTSQTPHSRCGASGAASALTSPVSGGESFDAAGVPVFALDDPSHDLTAPGVYEFALDDPSCDVMATGVATFALDDPSRDVVEETGSEDGGGARLLNAGGADDLDEVFDGDASIEDCLFDLSSRVPPGLAQKVWLTLQQLKGAEVPCIPGRPPDQEWFSADDKVGAFWLSDGGTAGESPRRTGSTDGTEALPGQPACPGCAALRQQLEEQQPADAQLEEQLEEEAAEASARSLCEVRLLSVELADSLRPEIRLEEAQEARAQADASRALAEQEQLEGLLAREQTELLAAEAKLEEVEWLCERLREEERAYSSELSGLRHRAADAEARLRASEHLGCQWLEELPVSRDEQPRLKAEVQALAEGGAEAFDRLWAEAAAAAASKAEAEAEASRAEQQVHSELLRAGGRLRSSERERAALRREREGAESIQAELQAEVDELAARAGLGALGGRARPEGLRSAPAAAERELRSELKRSSAKVGRLRLRMEAADRLREEGSAQAGELVSELARVCAERDALRRELDAEQGRLRKERSRRELLAGKNRKLREGGERFRTRLDEQLQWEVQRASAKGRRRCVREQMEAQLEEGRAGAAAAASELQECLGGLAEAEARQADLAAERGQLEDHLRAVTAQQGQEKAEEAALKSELACLMTEQDALRSELADTCAEALSECVRRRQSRREVSRLVSERQAFYDHRADASAACAKGGEAGCLGAELADLRRMLDPDAEDHAPRLGGQRARGCRRSAGRWTRR